MRRAKTAAPSRTIRVGETADKALLSNGQQLHERDADAATAGAP